MGRISQRGEKSSPQDSQPQTRFRHGPSTESHWPCSVELFSGERNEVSNRKKKRVEGQPIVNVIIVFWNVF